MRLVMSNVFRYLIESDAGKVVGEVLDMDGYELILYAYGERLGEVESLNDALGIMEELEEKLILELMNLEIVINELKKDIEHSKYIQSKILLNNQLERVQFEYDELENKLKGEFE